MTRPEDVLKLWFGQSVINNRHELSSLEYLNAYLQKWFFQPSPEFDFDCRKFEQVMHRLSSEEERDLWETDVSSNLARVILFDQLPRNAFRGTAAAFQYDQLALSTAKKMLESGCYTKLEVAELLFVRTALNHSENVADARMAIELDKTLLADHPSLNDILTVTLKASEEHVQILELFGRYPGRNLVLGRETTPQEAAFLKSPDCPHWCRSQMPTRRPGQASHM